MDIKKYHTSVNEARYAEEINLEPTWASKQCIENLACPFAKSDKTSQRTKVPVSLTLPPPLSMSLSRSESNHRSASQDEGGKMAPATVKVYDRREEKKERSLSVAQETWITVVPEGFALLPLFFLRGPRFDRMPCTSALLVSHFFFLFSGKPSPLLAG